MSYKGEQQTEDQVDDQTVDDQTVEEPQQPQSVRDTLNAAVEEHTQQDQQQQQTQETQFTLPQNWGDAEKANFNKIPQDVREWFLQQIGGPAAEFAEYKKQYEPIGELFKPWEQRLAANKQSMSDVVKNLLNVQLYLEREPNAAAQWLLDQVPGLDKAALAQYLTGGKAPAVTEEQREGALNTLEDYDPALAKLLKPVLDTVETVNQRFQTEDQRLAAERQANMNQSITEFLNEKNDRQELLYPYCSNQAVIQEMQALIASGVVNIAKEGSFKNALKTAYEKAIYSIPEVRSQIIAAERSAEAARRQARLNKAKRAGASVSGQQTSNTSQTRKGSVRELLNAAAEEQGMI